MEKYLLAIMNTQPAIDRSAPSRVTGRLLQALNAMVWQGLTRQEAAQAAGMKEHSLYVALRKPHVKAFYLSECEVLRMSGRAKRLHRLEALSNQDENRNAAVAAIKAADWLEESHAATGLMPMVPGFAILLVQPAPVRPGELAGESAAVDVTPRPPTIDHAARESRWPVAGASEDD